LAQHPSLAGMPLSFAPALAVAEEKVIDPPKPEEPPALEPDMICVVCLDLLSTSAIWRLDCTHAFHKACVESILSQERRVGGRLVFNWIVCPLCRSPLSHPDLTDRLVKEREIYEKVKKLVVWALDKNANGVEYSPTDVQDALSRMKVQQCNKCQEPYFAGMLGCLAGGDERDWNADDVNYSKGRCSRCMFEKDICCPTHGMEFIAFKCNFCCRKAPERNCFEGIYFCEPCHDAWNAGDKQRHCICLPENCMFKRPHPPSFGKCYAIGCSMCGGTEDPESWSAATYQAMSESLGEWQKVYEEHQKKWDAEHPQQK